MTKLEAAAQKYAEAEIAYRKSQAFCESTSRGAEDWKRRIDEADKLSESALNTMFEARKALLTAAVESAR